MNYRRYRHVPPSSTTNKAVHHEKIYSVGCAHVPQIMRLATAIRRWYGRPEPSAAQNR
jgi:hypothetical protein